MDRRDLEILQAIAERGTGSPEVIEAETDIPKSTVHYRVKKLREEGVITNDRYDVDLEKVGLEITVISEVMAQYERGYHARVGEKLGEVEGVNQVYFTMGDTDFVVISKLTGREMVERLIEDFEAIDEVERTSSKFVITTVKDESNPLKDYDIDKLLDAVTPQSDS